MILGSIWSIWKSYFCVKIVAIFKSWSVHSPGVSSLCANTWGKRLEAIVPMSISHVWWPGLVNFCTRSKFRSRSQYWPETARNIIVRLTTTTSPSSDIFVKTCKLCFYQIYTVADCHTNTIVASFHVLFLFTMAVLSNTWHVVCSSRVLAVILLLIVRLDHVMSRNTRAIMHEVRNVFMNSLVKIHFYCNLWTILASAFFDSLVCSHSLKLSRFLTLLTKF